MPGFLKPAVFSLGLACVVAGSISLMAQNSDQTSSAPPPVTFTADQDHQNMMDQLGIKALRPGPSGDEKAPNHANYDESKANPFPDLPDPLTLNNGQKVTSAETWWTRASPGVAGDVFEICLRAGAEQRAQGDVDRDGRGPGDDWLQSGDGQGPDGEVDNSSYPADQREST